jgi:hypothetical protein
MFRSSRQWFATLLCAAALVAGCDEPANDNPEAEKQAAAALIAAGARIGDMGGRVGKVDFSGKKVSDADFANIAKLPLLTQLLLVNSQFDEAGLAHLTRLKEVGQMSVQSTSVSDVGLESIGALKSLTELDLGATKITDAGLERLTGLTRLEKLYIEGTGATPGGVSKLKSKLPGLIIYGP